VSGDRQLPALLAHARWVIPCFWCDPGAVAACLLHGTVGSTACAPSILAALVSQTALCQHSRVWWFGMCRWSSLQTSFRRQYIPTHILSIALWAVRSLV